MGNYLALFFQKVIIAFYLSLHLAPSISHTHHYKARISEKKIDEYDCTWCMDWNIHRI